ncbi:MAG: riboflavin kinase [bacterium]
MIKKYSINGIVKPGQNKGRQIGLRTANLDVILAQELDKGLYTCEVILKNKKYAGLIYYGYNSLSKQDCLEMHIIGFDGDIYGREITVDIKKYLRGEKKFSSIADLKTQIQKDIESAC